MTSETENPHLCLGAEIPRAWPLEHSMAEGAAEVAQGPFAFARHLWLKGLNKRITRLQQFEEELLRLAL